MYSGYMFLGMFFTLLDTHCTLYRKLSCSILNCSSYKMNRKRNVKEMNQDKTPISFISNGLIYLLFSMHSLLMVLYIIITMPLGRDLCNSKREYLLAVTLHNLDNNNLENKIQIS